MESCEVLVVGAGPAGSSCAGLLRKQGLSVLLLDRDRFPRDKPCAGWVTPGVFTALRIDPQIYAREQLLQEIRSFRTGVMFGRELVTDYGRTVSYGIIRSEFDQFLLARSEAAARVGEPVRSIERSAQGWLVNGSIRARLLIGAGGNNCPVARALGAVPGKEPAIVALVAEYRMDREQLSRCRLACGTVALSFTRDLEGYGWLFRKGSYLNVGLGSMARSGLRAEASEFCAYLRRRGDLDEDISDRFKGHSYLPYRGNAGRKLVGDGALVIGDAAGVSFPESGEGILPALESAIMAAETVVRAGGDYREEKLAPYAAALAARFGAGGAEGSGFALPAGVKKRAGAALLSSAWFTRHLVLDRWFLHRRRTELRG